MYDFSIYMKTFITKTMVGETEFSEFILKGHAFDGVKKGIVMELKGGLVL